MIPVFLLGQNAEISVVDRETISVRNQKHNVALQYGCKYRTWQVHQSDLPTVYGFKSNAGREKSTNGRSTLKHVNF